MHYNNLDPSTELLLVSLLAVLLVGVLIRSVAVLYRKLVAIPHLYPTTWTRAQCILMDRFRLAIGIALILLWTAMLFAAPLMPTNWPFGFLEVLTLLVLLALTNGWLLLILPRDWSKMGALTSRFAVTIAVLSLWWSLMLGGATLMLVKASVSPAPLVIMGPVFA